MVQGQGWPLEQVEQHALHTFLVIVVTSRADWDGTSLARMIEDLLHICRP